MIGLYAGLRREEILGLKWDCVFLEGDTPYLSVRRAWHVEHNRPVITNELKTKAAKRDIPLPKQLAECLKEAKECSNSEFVIANRDGDPLSYTQFQRIWKYIRTRSVKEHTYYRYKDGKREKHVVPNKIIIRRFSIFEEARWANFGLNFFQYYFLRPYVYSAINITKYCIPVYILIQAIVFPGVQIHNSTPIVLLLNHLNFSLLH